MALLGYGLSLCYGFRHGKRLMHITRKCKDKLIARGYGPVHHKGKITGLVLRSLTGSRCNLLRCMQKCYCKKKTCCQGR